MRIGELARMADVSTRTVRHYHRVGVLPEPPRTSGGYRDYTLRDLIRLVHARRMVELGLGLNEVAAALADEEGKGLAEIIDQMDAELLEQERRIAIQRGRLAALRARIQDGRVGLDELGTLDLDEYSDFFARAEAAGASGTAFEFDRQLMSILPPEELRAWAEPLLPLLQDPELMPGVLEVYAAFDRLEDSEEDIERFVDDLFEFLPAPLLDRLADLLDGLLPDESVMAAIYDELGHAQGMAIRRIIERLIVERDGRGRDGPEREGQP